MKITFYRVLSFFIMICLASGLAACGAVKNTLNGNPSADKLSSQATVKNITVWHMWTSDTDSTKESFDVAAEKFTSANPDIQLKVEVVETEIYKTKIRLAIASNEAPDVFFSWGGGFSKPFVDSGKVLDIFEYLDTDTKSRIKSGALDNHTYNGKVYGLPFMTYVTCLFANKEMFEQNGIKLPQTYDELISSVKAFRKRGITPINVAGIELWPTMLWYDAMALSTAGRKISLDALSKRASFDQPAFVDAARKLQELVDAGAFQENFMKIGYSDAMEPVRQGKVPMILMGSWACSGFDNETSQVKGKIVPLKLPAVPGGEGGANDYLGGAIDCWMVSASTQDKAASVRVAAGIAEGMCREGYERNMLIPVWEGHYDESKVSPLMLQVIDMVKSADGFVPSWDTYLEASDAQIHLNLVTELMTNTITPEEFAFEMQKINETN